MRAIVYMLSAAALAVALLVAPVHGKDDAVRFRPVDIYVDSGERPLAAYQVEVRAFNATVAGIEGGEHPAFSDPPYYDAKALTRNRIILAAFNTGAEVPHGRTRVATLHMRVWGESSYEVHLMAAGNPAGQRIAAETSASPRE